MIIKPKIGSTVVVTAEKDGIAVGVRMNVRDVSSYESPVLAGFHSVLLGDTWFHNGEYRKLNIIERIYK